MAVSHWEAFMEIPKVFMRDYPSILFHALLTKIDDSLEDYSRSAAPGSTVVPYLINGVGHTLRQDYLLALTGQGAGIPDPSGTFGISARVNY